MKVLVIVMLLLVEVLLLNCQEKGDSFIKVKFDGNFNKYVASRLTYPLDAQIS